MLQFFESGLKRNAREKLMRKLAYVDNIFLRFSGLIERNVNSELTFDKKIYKNRTETQKFCNFLNVTSALLRLKKINE